MGVCYVLLLGPLVAIMPGIGDESFGSALSTAAISIVAMGEAWNLAKTLPAASGIDPLHWLMLGATTSIAGACLLLGAWQAATSVAIGCMMSAMLGLPLIRRFQRW